VTEFDKVIRPGGVGKVNANIDTTTLKGPVTKTVTVTTNDPDKPTFTLTMKVDVKVPIDVQPSETAMFQGRAGNLKPQELTLTATDGKPFDIVSVTPSDANVTATIAADPAENAGSPKAGTAASGAKKYVLKVQASPTLKLGSTSGSIAVKTTHPKSADMTIRYFANVTGNLQVMPERVMLSVPDDPPTEGVTQHVALKRAPDATGQVKVKSTASSDARVTAKLTTKKDGEDYDLAVTYSGPPPTSSTIANVTVETTDSLQPTLTIPVHVRAQAPASVAPPTGDTPGHEGHGH